MTGCVFVGRIKRGGEVNPIIQDFTESLFDYAVDMAKLVRQGRDVENQLLTEITNLEKDLYNGTEYR